MNYNKTMTKQEMLASLEAQIRKDIPRLTELSEGCVLLNKSNKDKFEIIDIDTDFYEYVCLKNKKHITSIAFKNINLFEIIGHDIMLNDVLEWLNSKNKNIAISSDGTLFELNKAIFYRKIGIGDYGIIKWDLSKLLLKDQSEKLIKFLYDLKQKIDE